MQTTSLSRASKTRMDSNPSQPANERADVVNLLSSDEDGSESPPREPASLPMEVPADDDELEVISCKRAAPKGSRTRRDDPSASQGQHASKGADSGAINRDTQQSNNRPEGLANDPVSGAIESGKASTKKSGKKKGTKSTNTDDGDLVFVLEKTVLNTLEHYPHFRFDCSIHPFRRMRTPRKQEFCEKCFCYVCDTEASKCSEWMNHYKAISTSTAWRNMRKTRQEDRRKLANAVDDPVKGTQFARFLTPTAVSELATDGDSNEDEDGPITDVMERTNWYCEGDAASSSVVDSVLQTLLDGDDETVLIDDIQSVVARSESRISTRRSSGLTIDTA